MVARSPFSVATVAGVCARTATPDFAAQLYVDGVAHVGQTDFVAIKSRDPAQASTIFLEVGKSAEDGMKVERVKWSDQIGKSTVDVSKGGEKATLIFDEAQVVAMAGALTQIIQPGQPEIQYPGAPFHRYRFDPSVLRGAGSNKH
jgi:hypothetical protein